MTDTDPEANPWTLLIAELDCWSDQGHIATMWWRDDDATTPGPKLDRLLKLTEETGILLAVIPLNATPELGSVVAGAPHVEVAQHGYAHKNHAPRGQGLGAWELGLHRGEQAVLADLDLGRVQIEGLFPEQFKGVIVPPWNRVDPALFGPMATRGYCGISAFGPREQKEPVPDFILSNAHGDPLRWREGPLFTGEAKVLDQIIEHLRARRTGAVDEQEPTGFLTHHIVLDTAAWEFCEKLSTTITQHSAARWCHPAEVFGPRTP